MTYILINVRYILRIKHSNGLLIYIIWLELAYFHLLRRKYWWPNEGSHLNKWKGHLSKGLKRACDGYSANEIIWKSTKDVSCTPTDPLIFQTTGLHVQAFLKGLLSFSYISPSHFLKDTFVTFDFWKIYAWGICTFLFHKLFWYPFVAPL